MEGRGRNVVLKLQNFYLHQIYVSTHNAFALNTPQDRTQTAVKVQQLQPTYRDVEGDLVPRADGVHAHLVPAVVGQRHQSICGRVVQDLTFVIGGLKGRGGGAMGGEGRGGERRGSRIRQTTVRQM